MKQNSIVHDWENPVQNAFTAEMERRGYKLELPRNPDNTVNPNALEHQGSRYPTFVSADGKVKLAVSRDTYFERGPGEVFRGDLSSFIKDGFTLEIITTDPKSRGAGLAGKVMRDVVDASDVSGAKLYGEVAPVKTMAGKKALTRNQLHKWYAKLGFKKTGLSLIEREPTPAATGAAAQKMRDRNARLIAAAPDLLSALTELLDQLQVIGIPDWHGAEGLDLQQARAAIAKAGGDK